MLVIFIISFVVAYIALGFIFKALDNHVTKNYDL